jgi:hypothetical protein
MLAATGSAIAALLLARSTVIGPGPALHSSLAVAATGFVPTTVVRSNSTDSIPIRRTESLRVRTVPPKVAVIVPLWSDVTGVVLMGNVIVVEPAGTVTLAGVVADGSVSLMEITRPPAGAGLASCSLPVTDWHPATIDLLRLNVGAEGSLSSIRTISSRVRMVTPRSDYSAESGKILSSPPLHHRRSPR